MLAEQSTHRRYYIFRRRGKGGKQRKRKGAALVEGEVKGEDEERGTATLQKKRFIFRSKEQRRPGGEIKSSGTTETPPLCIHGNVPRFRLVTSSFLNP